MKTLLATLVGATLLASVPAQAATDFYLNIANLKGGGSTVKGYENQIEVLSWSWGLSNTGTATSGAGRVSLQDFSWTQYANASLVDLFGFLTDPDLTPGKATLSAVSTGAGGYNYFQLVFNQNQISSLSLGGAAGDPAPGLAHVSMAMADVTLRYRPNSASAAWIEASYSALTNDNALVFSGDPMALEGLRLAMAPAAAVPEPASWALMLGGLVLTGAALRRRLSR